MLTLRLLPALHREQAIIKVSFPYNRDLIDKIKRYQEGLTKKIKDDSFWLSSQILVKKISFTH
jgi:hypothetical protein